MKKIGLILVIALAMSSCQKQKFGFVNNTKVINEVNFKKDLEAKFNLKEEKINKKADSLGRSFQEEVKVASELAATLKDQNRIQELSQNLQQKNDNLSRMLQGEKQQLANEYRTEVDSLIANVKTFVKDYGKSNGYDYIFGTSDNTASVMYGPEGDDLTEEIIKKFNDKK
jgi:outer membrane protein|tara:strand:- start:175 stop:684 length:510 start_codon:yes stop_codon:yes gene_type:complete